MSIQKKELSLPTLSKSNPGVLEHFHSSKQAFKSSIRTKKIHQIAILILCAAVAITIPVVVPLASLTIIGAFTPWIYFSIFALISIASIRSLLFLMGLCNLTPPQEDPPFTPKKLGLPSVGKWQHMNDKDRLKVYPIINSCISNEYKLELLKKAKYSIIMSGCYCGGKIFQRALEIIKDKLEKKEIKDVKIISSPLWLDRDNKKLINSLSKQFPTTFQCISPPESYLLTNGKNQLYLMSGNHIKGLVVDNCWAIVGGSGIADPWTVKLDREKTNFKMPAQGFLDIDFLLKGSKQGVVSLVSSQLRAVFSKYQKMLKKKEAPSNHHQTFSFPYHSYKIQKKLQGFNVEAAKVITCHPLQKKKYLEDEMIQMLDNAKKNVFISQMYFIPTKKILVAMQRALKRGVDFTIITNGISSRGPGVHIGFVPYCRYLLSKLAKIAKPGKMRLLESIRPGYNWHHKVFAVDDALIFGSANLNFKSLRGRDHELNLLVKSQKLVEQTKKKILIAAAKACRIVSFQKISKQNWPSRWFGKVQKALLENIAY